MPSPVLALLIVVAVLIGAAFVGVALLAIAAAIAPRHPRPTPPAPARLDDMPGHPEHLADLGTPEDDVFDDLAEELRGPEIDRLCRKVGWHRG